MIQAAKERKKDKLRFGKPMFGIGIGVGAVGAIALADALADMTGSADFLRNEPDALIKVLSNAGVKYDYKLYGDEEHPLGHVFHCDIKSEAAKQANDDECDFFKSLI